MNSNEKKKIFEKLKDLGITIQDSTQKKLLLSFEEYLNKEYENEVKLLEEVNRIKKKEKNNKELTQFEISFMKNLKISYS